ncbi:MAG: efflux RND transporter permease subunit [Elusimicrobiota bacterium]
MIKKILNRPVTFIMLFTGIVIVGIISTTMMPLELMPNTTFGEISIIFKVRGGIPPDKIESFVAKPVEEAVGGVNNIKDIISISEEGETTIILKFAPGTNMDVATLEVREKLAQIKNKLPREVERPVVAQYEQEDIPVLIIGVTSLKRTPEDIKKIIDDTIKKRLSRIEGVANVEVFGGRERKIIIEFIPKKLQSYGVSVAKIINSINRANVSLVAGGEDESESGYTIKATGRFENINEIRNLGIAVSKEGSIIRLKDIAVIKDSYLEPNSMSRLNKNQNVTIYIQKETLASTVKVSRQVNIELEDVRNVIPKDLVISKIKDDSEYIKKALNSMKISLLLGALLAAGVLFFFLKNLKLTLIIFITIPTSIFLAISLLNLSKITLNVMTLGGLALGVGMLLDNAIVVIENVFRTSKDIKNRFNAVVEGTQQMVVPIVAATLTTIVVFLPMVFLSEEIKQLQESMGITIAYSLVASLFVALTLVPILFFRLKIKPRLKKRRKYFIEWFKKFLESVIHFRYQYIGLAGILFIASILIFMNKDMNLFETEEANKFTINIELPTGTKLEVSDEKVKAVEEILEDYPEVKTISSKIEKWSSKVYVTLTKESKRERTKSQIEASLRPKLKNIQPAFIYFKESQELAAKEVFIEIYGHNYATLKELAMSIGGTLKAIKNLKDVKIRMREGRPEKRVVLDRRKTSIFGLSVADVSRNLHARLRGLVATRYHEKAKEIETIVRQYKQSIVDFKDLYGIKMMTPFGGFISLAQIADFLDEKGPSEIWRKNKKRMVQVSATRDDISLEKAAEEIRNALKQVKFPESYFYEIGGDYEMMIKSKRELYNALALTVILIYLVLASLFESYTQPFIIMISVPLAFVGVVAALMITKTSISIGVITGIIMLAGIVVNNAIIMVDRINHLKKQNSNINSKLAVVKSVIEGSSQRVRPIMMTAITTILGLLPLALKGGEGSGLWKPLSITVIGGLVSSTFLVLFIVPCIYMVFEKNK